jgi:hypothetical protein
MILVQKISVTHMGPSANMTHFVAFVISFQDIVAFKLPFGANWVIDDSKDYYLLVTVSQIFVKNLWYLPQNETP